ncbi:MAG: Asp-tRNA(Asn)/Glu-tRNA(Gln) amidotransferase GatCAB subunit B, partial [Deltaproteobacteria bacterium]|nr:Asp-tRNA(Asn)/Glu-tRNA(Gln) amidotransferase GatCAB subunit B [Deltaproteobacteria bacterium]
SEYFTSCAVMCEDRKRLSNWIIKELFKLLNDSSISITACPVAPVNFARLIELISKGEITEVIARTVLYEMFTTGKEPDTVINEKDLKPIKNDDILIRTVEEVLKENPEASAQIKAGELKPVDFILGRVIKKTRGKADPKKVREIIGKTLL